MKNLLIIFSGLIMFSFFGCGEATSKVKTSETKSVTCGKLIKIYAKSEMQGIMAEYKWLDKNYPGYQKISQALVNCDGIPTDIIRIKTSNGETKDIYFDISSFFGKY